MTNALDNNWPHALDAYRPIDLLSTGQTSKVVRAVEDSTGREVALKILHEYLADDEPVRRRLRREFAAVRRLNHPAVVRADDLVDHGPTLALVMEFVDGQSVRRRVTEQGPLPWEEARPIVDDILAALQQAHQRGILHRDLNAEHVLIGDDGRGRIIGFGLARVDELVALTMHTQVLGSLEAMAPERVLGMDYDGRADLYSAGAVAHELLLGYPPVDPTMGAAFARANRGDHHLQDQWPDDLPEDAQYFLKRSLVADPGARFATAAQMRRALDGDYDPKLWQGLVARQTKNCPQCDTAVLDGLLNCLECGFEFRRLVQNPGGGDLAIQIISPRQAFEPDVWFERNPEPDYLHDDMARALMELLDAYEDTRPVVHWSPEYRWPPYILLTALDDDDAERISSLLDSEEIPHDVLENGRPRTRRKKSFLESEDPEIKEQLMINGAVLVSMAAFIVFIMLVDPEVTLSGEHAIGLGFVLALPVALILLVFTVVQLAKIERRTFAALLVATLTAGAIAGVGLALSTPSAVAAAALAAFALAFFNAGFGSEGLRTRLGTGDDRPQAFGLPLMIPHQSLEAVKLPDNRLDVPRRTSRVLNRCNDDHIRREIHELIVLAIAVAQRQQTPSQEIFTELIDEILSTGEELDRLTQQVRQVSTAELYDRLETTDSTPNKANGGPEASPIEDRRKQILEAIEAHDEAVRRMTRCRTTLQLARGSLIDLLDCGQATSQRVILDLNQDTTDPLGELTIELEARRQVEADLATEVAR